MKLINEIKEILKEERYHQLATASSDGIPNVCCISSFYIEDDETIIIVDNFFNKTRNNVIENPRVSLLFRKDKSAYQIKGQCRYIIEGPVYDKARSWMKSKGDVYPAKGALIVTIEEIYKSKPGPDAGKKIA
jgi:predicted pyridoxine 5'-phosphate oxidase superfamily flavin-nucleotide-binding protein